MIVDTGPFVATANLKDPDHLACRKVFADTNEKLYVPAMVVAEATFMIEKSGGPRAEALFLRSLRSERYVIEAPTRGDLRRAAELVELYADLPLGGTDASVIALSERLKDNTIFTLDRRHFSVVQPPNSASFTLLP